VDQSTDCILQGLRGRFISQKPVKRAASVIPTECSILLCCKSMPMALHGTFLIVHLHATAAPYLSTFVKNSETSLDFEGVHHIEADNQTGSPASLTCTIESVSLSEAAMLVRSR
jgi:hypothetical protein